MIDVLEYRSLQLDQQQGKMRGDVVPVVLSIPPSPELSLFQSVTGGIAATVHYNDVL